MAPTLGQAIYFAIRDSEVLHFNREKVEAYKAEALARGVPEEAAETEALVMLKVSGEFKRGDKLPGIVTQVYESGWVDIALHHKFQKVHMEVLDVPPRTDPAQLAVFDLA